MQLPSPSPQYDAGNEAQTRDAIRREDGRNQKIGQDVEIGSAKLVLTSPDGTRWSITIGNTGTISGTAL